MKKNGFTFIEILGVLTLLALISVIVLVSVNKSLKSSKQTIHQSQEENIKSAASMWMADNAELIPDTGYHPVTLGMLQDEGYIKEVIDSETNEPYDRNMIIGISLNDVKIENKVLKTVFERKGNNQFDGTNYINTNIYLFNNDNVNKDFEISFELPDFDASNQVSHATIMNSLDETGKPYPGILVRRNSTTEYIRLVTNNHTTPETGVSFTYTNNFKISILRYNNKVFYRVDNGPYKFIKDYADFNMTFSVPVTFGASLNSSLEPFRYYVGTIKDIKIRMED